MIKLLFRGKKASIAGLTPEAAKSEMPQGHMIVTFWYMPGIRTQFMGGIALVP